MNAISRQKVPASTQLLMRILDRPGLVAAVRDLPGAGLGKLIDRVGLEDAGELVARAARGRRRDVSAGAVRAVAAGDARGGRGGARATAVRAAAGARGPRGA